MVKTVGPQFGLISRLREYFIKVLLRKALPLHYQVPPHAEVRRTQMVRSLNIACEGVLEKFEALETVHVKKAQFVLE